MLLATCSTLHVSLWSITATYIGYDRKKLTPVGRREQTLRGGWKIACRL